MTSLTVVCPNARRCAVKVTGTTLLRKVLEEACLQQGFDSDGHELRHQGRALDGALPVRLSGLANNASLDLVPVQDTAREHGDGGVAEIAVQVRESRSERPFQMNDGRRAQRALPVDSSLLDVLAALNPFFQDELLTLPSGLVPACSYMTHQVLPPFSIPSFFQWKGEVELAAVTLKSIGITRGSRVLLRYSALALSSQELAEIEKRVREERERRDKMQGRFQMLRDSNLQRESDERQRMLEYERELATQEQAAREALREAETRTAGTTHADSGPARSTQGRDAEGGQRGVRLQQLQDLLSQVNTSLNSNEEDFLAERLLTDRGAIPVSSLTASTKSEFADFKFPETMEVDVAAREEAVRRPAIVAKCERKAEVFNRRISVNTDSNCGEIGSSEGLEEAEKMETEDPFFELSVSDAQSIQRDRRNEVRNLCQGALLPKAFVVAKNRELKAAAYPHTVIRFILPQGNILQARFLSSEPVSHLYETISNLLNTKASKTTFTLAMLGVQFDRRSGKSLLESDLAPTANVILRFQPPVDELDQVFQTSAYAVVSPEAADESSREWLSANSIFVPYNPTVDGGSQTAATVAKRQADSLGMSSEVGDGAGGGGRPVELPKWMRRK